MENPSWKSHLIALAMPATVGVALPAAILIASRASPGNPWFVAAGLCLGIAGLALFLVTFRLFLQVGKGTLAPWQPTRHLVVIGPYRHCRNPMISGVLGILLGEALFFFSWAILVYAAVFFAINTVYFKLSEEPGLERQHGDEYRRYRRAVPMWLPKLKPYSENSQG